MPTDRDDARPCGGGSGEIVVDLAAIEANIRWLIGQVSPAEVMVVVKADGYGHGMVQAARAARRAGAGWLGVATAAEALALRAAGDTGKLACWLLGPGDDLSALVSAGVDLTAYTVEELDAIAAASDNVPARIQLKIDTGLSRGGATAEQWPQLVARAASLVAAGRIEVRGIWSHLACADEPDHPANAVAEQRFAAAVAEARAAGLRPMVCHLANSAGALLRPSARFDLVRIGLACYGLNPAPSHLPDLPLTPAMTVRAPLALVKDVAAGEGVSYGHQWIAPVATRLGLVPVGYAEGVLRHASNRAEVALGGRRRRIRGRVCMDQFMVDLGPAGEDGARVGDLVTLFGPGTKGEPTAQDWAEACETINYEIVTRIGGRLSRRYLPAMSEESQ